MATEPTPNPSIDIVEGASGVLVGAGIVTMALFPLALPLIALIVVAALPLLLVALAVALIVAVVAAPILLLRRVAGTAIGPFVTRVGDRLRHRSISPRRGRAQRLVP
jgi:hypothetical protein